MLKNKKIVVGVTGGIACYKTVELVSRLRKAGAKVEVIMSEAARHFVSPITFESVANCTVFYDQFEKVGGNITHINLAEEADAVVIAPLTANTAAKIAYGFADNLLTTIILATRAPILLAPAMNVNMWHNEVFQNNLSLLRRRGFRIAEPASGFQACGAEGKGRMAEPEIIFNTLDSLLNGRHDFEKLRILLTAGPTREALDPVRFLTNNSTGKMGYAIAEAAVNRGAGVILVSGPVNIAPPRGVEIIPVNTAREMYQAVLKHFSDVDIVIKSAAVSDYRPLETKEQKIKKTEDQFSIQMVKNPDILLELGKLKKSQLLVGFAAETENIIEYAHSKLKQKNLDLIVANDVSRSDAGFAVEQNQVTLIDRKGRIEELPLMSKNQVADKILDVIKLIMDNSGAN